MHELFVMIDDEVPFIIDNVFWFLLWHKAYVGRFLGNLGNSNENSNENDTFYVTLLIVWFGVIGLLMNVVVFSKVHVIYIPVPFFLLSFSDS